MKEKIMNWKLLAKAENFVKQNGSTISMVGAMVSLGLALYSAYKASNKVVKIKDEYDKAVAKAEEEHTEEELKAAIKDVKSMKNIKLVLAYKFVILFGGSALGLMLLSKYIDGITIAGLTTLVMKNQDKLENLAKNAKEMIGEEKFKEVEDKSLEDLITQNFTDGPVALQPKFGAGDMYVDMETGTLFQMQKEDLELAMQNAKDYCNRNHGLFIEKWFSIRGLELPSYLATSKGNMCWGPNNPFDAYIGRRTVFGMTVNTVEYAHPSKPPKYSGVPNLCYR
jgi:hypothetical protein